MNLPKSCSPSVFPAAFLNRLLLDLTHVKLCNRLAGTLGSERRIRTRFRKIIESSTTCSRGIGTCGLIFFARLLSEGTFRKAHQKISRAYPQKTSPLDPRCTTLAGVHLFVLPGLSSFVTRARRALGICMFCMFATARTSVPHSQIPEH